MATFLLVHGASANSGYWRYVEPLLREAGHRSLAVDLPSMDEAADFRTYADAAIEQVGGAEVDVVVAQSLGAFTAGVVAEALRPRKVVLLAPMIPAPGESPAQWGDAVGQAAAVREHAAAEQVSAEFDPVVTMFHDVPDEVTKTLWDEGEPGQAVSIFTRPFPLTGWPDVATRVVAAEYDRLFPLPLQRRLARERLGVEVEAIPTGHLAAFARPDLVALAATRSVP